MEAKLVIAKPKKAKLVVKKSFSNGWGSKELSREEYIEYWLETTYHYTTLFYKADRGAELFDFRCALEEIAGKYWDEHEVSE
jgi:hypothetical protein